MLLKTNKTKRLDDAYRMTWPQPPEEPAENEWTSLRSVWEGVMSPELASLVFPEIKPGANFNQDVIVPALNELQVQIEGPYTLQHSDLLIRYSCCCLCLRESAAGLLKILQFLVVLFDRFRQECYQVIRV